MSIKEAFDKSYSINNLTSAKLHHYLNIYDELFIPYKNKSIKMLEIGINQGGSIEMWNLYFKNIKKFIGIDIMNDCKKLEKKFNNLEIYIGNQEDNLFLQNVSRLVGDIDILIDDGGHQFNQQINSFEKLFHNITEGGLYIIEDTHTSYDNYANYHPKDNVYGGGKNKSYTTIEYFKNLCDEVTAWAYYKKHGICPINKPHGTSWLDFKKKNNISKDKLDYLREYIYSITFYDSIIIIKKRKKTMPYIVFNNKDGGQYIGLSNERKLHINNS